MEKVIAEMGWDGGSHKGDGVGTRTKLWGWVRMETKQFTVSLSSSDPSLRYLGG